MTHWSKRGSQVTSRRRCENGRSQGMGFKGAVGSVVLSDVPWTGALEAFKVSPWRGPAADSQLGNWGCCALGAEGRQARGEGKR